ncbi:MAG: helix-turn-helix transcriptional regulator [Nitrospira sp.]|nr:helix-turn-helix transcriptional regulator [Nitrospira sp.]
MAEEALKPENRILWRETIHGWVTKTGLSHRELAQLLYMNQGTLKHWTGNGDVASDPFSDLVEAIAILSEHPPVEKKLNTEVAYKVKSLTRKHRRRLSPPLPANSREFDEAKEALNLDTEILAEKIKQWIRLTGLRYTQLSNWLGVNSTTIATWRSGERKPNVHILERLICLAQNPDGQPLPENLTGMSEAIAALNLSQRPTLGLRIAQWVEQTRLTARELAAMLGVKRKYIYDWSSRT